MKLIDRSSTLPDWIPFHCTTHTINKQVNVKNSQSATSFFSKGREKEKKCIKVIKKAKRSTRTSNNFTNTLISSSISSALAQETLEGPVFNTKSKKKLA